MKNESDNFKMAYTQIKNSDNVLIVGHINPDFDSLASVLALYRALKQMGKKVEAWSESTIPENMQFLPGSKEIIYPPFKSMEFDLIITMDCPVLERLGDEIKPLITKGKSLINIDHHISNNFYGSINLVNPSAASTGEIVWSLLKQMNCSIDVDIATCIYTTIVADTGCFRYSNTSIATHELAAELLKSGLKADTVMDALFHNMTLPKLRLFRDALDHLELICNGRACIGLLTSGLYDKTETTHLDSEGIVDYIRSIKDVEVAVLLGDLNPKDEIRLSFRSNRDDLDVNKLAGFFGGGGHRNASGARVQGPIESVKREVFEGISDLLDEPIGSPVYV